MSLIRQFKLLLLLPAFCLTLGASHAKNLPENGLLARLHALAARARLNLIVNSPDRSLGDFRPSDADSSIKHLLEIAGAADCTAGQTGSVWLINARQNQTFHNYTGWKFFYPSDSPVESLLARKNDNPAAGTRTFAVPTVNACVISGERMRVAKTAEYLQSLEKPAVPAELHLAITSGNSLPTASLSVQILTNTSFFLELAAHDFEPLVATFSFLCDASGSFDLKLENTAANVSDNDVSLDSRWQLNAQKQNPLILRCNDRVVTINWNARLLKPFPEIPGTHLKNNPADRAGQKAAPLHSDSEPEMNMALFNEPFAKILGRIAASESLNLAIDKDLSGNLSVFFFGPDLYFEEQVNSIARSVGGSVRKTGNTWLVAPEGRFVDAFDFGYNITRRLQYSDAEATAAILKACLAGLKAPADCRVASDRVINAIMLAGSAEITDGLMQLLAELDRPPLLFDGRLSLQSDAGHFSETFSINTGRISNRQIELKDATAEIEFLPVRLPHLTEPGLKMQTSVKLKSGLSLKLAFWSALPGSDSGPLFAFRGSSSASLFMSGVRSEHQLADHRDLSHESQDENGSGTDDAFDSSF